MLKGHIALKDQPAYEKAQQWVRDNPSQYGKSASKGHATRIAIQTLGHLTPLRALAIVASHLYGAEVVINTVAKFRREWRILNISGDHMTKTTVGKSPKSPVKMGTEASRKVKALINSHPEWHQTANSQRDAVFKACEKLEDETSANTLQLLAHHFWGRGEIQINLVYKTRMAYRKRNGIVNDCRSYATQHRRDMLPDTIELAITPKEFVSLKSILSTLRPILDRAHSIDQLRQWAAAVS